MTKTILEKLQSSTEILVSGEWYIVDTIDEETQTVQTIRGNNHSRWTEFTFKELEDKETRFFGIKELKDENPVPVFNSGHIAEGLQTCHIINSMIDDFLIDHPAVLKVEGNSELKMAQDLINAVYQRIGTLDVT